MKLWSYLISSAVAVLTGCATLNVNVEIYKHPLPTSVNIPAAAKIAKSVLAEPVFNDDQRRDIYASQKKEIREQVTASNQSAYEKEGKSTDEAKDLAEKRWKGIERSLDSAWAEVNEVASQVMEAAVSLEASAVVSDSERVFTNYKALWKLIRAYLEKSQNFVTQVRSALDVPLRTFPTQAEGIIQTTEIKLSVSPELASIAASTRVEGRLVGYPIFDRSISKLSSDRDHWAGFLKAHFKTFGGNARFVVVREGLVVYRQKSLDFDPTPVIAAGTAMTKLGLKVAAALASGRVSNLGPGTSPDERSPPAQASRDILVNESEIRTRQVVLANRQSARVQTLYALADLHQKILGSLSDRPPTGDEIAKFKQEFSSLIQYYQGRIAATETLQ